MSRITKFLLKITFKKAIIKLKTIVLPLIKKTSYYEEVWESRPLEDVKKYIPDQDRPSRDWLASEIKTSLQHFKIENPKILEVGCDLGANLFSLKKILTENSELIGADISHASITSAKKYMESLESPNIKFYQAKADDLSIFDDNYFDVVFTDAVLLYVADDKINQAVNEMMRVSKKMIFLLELSSQNNSAKANHTLDGWIRNYKTLIESNNAECDVSISNVTIDIRSAGRWPSQGELIKAVSSNNFI